MGRGSQGFRATEQKRFKLTLGLGRKVGTDPTTESGKEVVDSAPGVARRGLSGRWDERRVYRVGVGVTRKTSRFTLQKEDEILLRV